MQLCRPRCCGASNVPGCWPKLRIPRRRQDRAAGPSPLPASPRPSGSSGGWPRMPRSSQGPVGWPRTSHHPKSLPGDLGDPLWRWVVWETADSISAGASERTPCHADEICPWECAWSNRVARGRRVRDSRPLRVSFAGTGRRWGSRGSAAAEGTGGPAPCRDSRPGDAGCSDHVTADGSSVAGSAPAARDGAGRTRAHDRGTGCSAPSVQRVLTVVAGSGSSARPPKDTTT